MSYSHDDFGADTYIRAPLGVHYSSGKYHSFLALKTIPWRHYVGTKNPLHDEDASAYLAHPQTYPNPHQNPYYDRYLWNYYRSQNLASLSYLH
uniref:Uncharacterized protein n=1 Tax=Acrobeloides nanus TaxID=290746 RepID=A0A914CMW8_9BILA